MTSRELTSSFDFWSRGHLRMAVTHLPIKYDADIFIQSWVIDIFPKFKMAAAAIWDFQVMWIWPFRHVDSVVFVVYQIWFKYLLLSLRSTHLSFRFPFDDVARINFRFRLLVTWSSPYGREASFHKIWYRYLYQIWSYWHFREIKDGGRRHLGFVGGSHETTREGVFVVRTPCKNFVVIG